VGLMAIDMFTSKRGKVSMPSLRVPLAQSGEPAVEAPLADASFVEGALEPVPSVAPEHHDPEE
jgi:hypothetical protein